MTDFRPYINVAVRRDLIAEASAPPARAPAALANNEWLRRQ